jgi:ABC-2 type transport system ATP-binding protein
MAAQHGRAIETRPILEAHNLIKHYGNVAAVQGVSFHIDAGEIFSLLGPNGAGKSTIISILSTLLPPTSGTAMIGGHSIIKNPMAVRRLIGMVPQEIALYDDLSARENLRFWGQMYGMHGRPLRQRIDEVLAQIGLTDKATQPVKTFSGGMKRRLNIGVGLLHRPRLVFMDEPTVGLDPQSRRAILDMVRDLNRHGMSVLYTTHYMEEAAELSERVGIIDHGKMIALGTPKQLTQQVGQSDTLRLHVGEDHKVTALAQALRAVPGVQQVSVTDQHVVLIVPSAAAALVAVVSKASEVGAKIRAVDIQEPNLEAVFLHLTGRALRD